MLRYFVLFKLLFLLLLASCADREELEAVPEYMELTKTISSIGSFDNFDPMNAWQLIIPRKNAAGGPFVVDRKEEPGYLAGVSRGLNYALEHRIEPVSVELLEKIRELSVENVDKFKEDKKDKKERTLVPGKTHFQAQIGGRGVRFELTLGSNASDDGLKAFENKIRGIDYRKIAVDKEDNKLYYTRKEINREILYPVVQKIIDTYENGNKTIRDIVILIQDLFQLHPFNDANTRTIIIILLQKELARNNFTPIILFRPKLFAGYTVDEIIDREMIPGQEYFKNLI